MSELSPRQQAYVDAGLPKPGSPENVAMIIAAALDQLRADARSAGLEALDGLLEVAFNRAVKDCQEFEEEKCSHEQ